MRHSSHNSLIEIHACQMRSCLNDAGKFIVDFLAPKRRVIVEVDGMYHARRVAADARRDHKLERMGYRIVRIDAELVRSNLAQAVALIRAALAEPP